MHREVRGHGESSYWPSCSSSIYKAELTKFGLCPKPETMRCMTVSGGSWEEGVKGEGGSGGRPAMSFK